MSPDSAFLLSLLAKMAVSAACVVTTAFATERSGPVVGAVIATLPVSAGPNYVFLALDHGAAFVADAALASLPMNAATVVAGLAYVRLAQRRGVLACLAGTLAVWAALALAVRGLPWSLAGGLAVNAAAFALCLPLVRRYRAAAMPRARPRWTDLPLRAALVAAVVAIVVVAGNRFGPTASGVLALFPVVITSLILILHRRIGGPATAAVVANSLFGLIGFGLAIAALQAAARPLGAAAALLAALGVSLAWSVAWLLQHHARLRRAAAE